MHDHLFYPAGGGVFHEMATSFPRLYLAAGVTTIRTTGSIEPYADLEIKRDIERGVIPGPKIWITGPYIEGDIPWTEQLRRLHGPAEFRRMVDYWADQGATSFKLYNFPTREEMGAAIDESHKRGIKITGHLCSVGFTEAARLGIDDLEHGIWVDTEFYSKKKPDECPAREAFTELNEMSPADPRLAALIQELVKRHVAVTSTLPVFDALVEAGFRRALTPAVMDALSTETRSRLLANHLAGRAPEMALKMNKLEMAFEVAFVKAGGSQPASGLRRPARSRAAGRGGLHAAGSAAHRLLERRRLPRAGAADRQHRAGEGRGSGGGEGRPVEEHRRRGEGGDRLQGRRRVRPAETGGLGPRAGGNSLMNGLEWSGTCRSQVHESPPKKKFFFSGPAGCSPDCVHGVHALADGAGRPATGA
jgi:hypothetical protein